MEGTQCYNVGDYSLYGEADDAPATFSNYATQPRDFLHTVAAPGDCVITTSIRPKAAGGPPNGDVWDGTSFASPHIAGEVAVCIADGRCSSSKPLTNLARIQGDSAIYNLTHRGYGFQGDPLRPQPGHYYGFLVRAGDF